MKQVEEAGSLSGLLEDHYDKLSGGTSFDEGVKSGLFYAMEIVRQHQAEQPQKSLIELFTEARDKFPHQSVAWAEFDKAIAISLRHYEGRPAVPGKPLELMTRDELLAHVRKLAEPSQDAVDKVGIAWLRAYGYPDPEHHYHATPVYKACAKAAIAAMPMAPQPQEAVERVKAMAVAHKMSHEPFCDAAHWKNEFEKEYQAAMSAMGGAGKGLLPNPPTSDNQRGYSEKQLTAAIQWFQEALENKSVVDFQFESPKHHVAILLESAGRNHVRREISVISEIHAAHPTNILRLLIELGKEASLSANGCAYISSMAISEIERCIRSPVPVAAGEMRDNLESGQPTMLLRQFGGEWIDGQSRTWQPVPKPALKAVIKDSMPSGCEPIEPVKDERYKRGFDDGYDAAKQEPVSSEVSLTDCAIKVKEVYPELDRPSVALKIAKAVLNTAGVKYVD